MATLKAEGIWGAKAIDANSGANDKDLVEIVINVEITDGPDKGRRCTYSEIIDGKSAQYAAQSMRAVGWQGKSVTTLKADVAAFVAKTGGATSVEIKHLEIKTGKRAGSTWDKVNSIGRTARVLKPATGERLTDADDQLRRAMADDAHGGFGGDDSQSEDNIPF